MPSFRALREEWLKNVSSLADKYGIKEELVKKLMAYTKCLPIEKTSFIDESIFAAQMSRHFELSNQAILNRMYDAARSDAKVPMTVLDYTNLLCIFLSDDQDVHIEFAFKVYSGYSSGHNPQDISNSDMRVLLRPCVENTADDVAEIEENLKDICEVVKATCGVEKDQLLTLEHFQKIVKKNYIMLQCLGECIPNREPAERFKLEIYNRSVTQIERNFQSERRKSLRDYVKPPKKGLYPVRLSMS